MRTKADPPWKFEAYTKEGSRPSAVCRRAQLESHRREITALFCDLRGFTGFTEIADAEDVMALLRDYHAAIGEIIIKYSGTLERYAGDGASARPRDRFWYRHSAWVRHVGHHRLRGAL
jgi:class 3 adenylate cyclase